MITDGDKGMRIEERWFLSGGPVSDRPRLDSGRTLQNTRNTLKREKASLLSSI